VKSVSTVLTTAGLIREYISEQPNEQLITRRDIIGLGPERAVDNAIADLIETKVIERVAQGVYKKRERTSEISVLEIASVKAKAFKRNILTHAADIAHEMGISAKGNPHKFATDGRSSSFMFGDIEVRMEGVSHRKMSLGDSVVGKLIRALCHIGKDAVTYEIVNYTTRLLSHEQRVEIGKLCSSMPGWLSKFFVGWNLLTLVEQKAYEIEDTPHGVMENTPVYMPLANLIPFMPLCIVDFTAKEKAICM